MATRKIKDAKDLETNELIFFKGHAKATFMSDGKTVEDAINQIGMGGGGGITVETDPVFSASPAASITEAKKEEWDGKYSKPSGGIPASDLASDVFLQGEKGEKGDKGDQGEQGQKGDDGVGIASVVQTTTSSADGGSNVMTVTLSNGTKSTFTVKNGSKGSQGEQGPKGDKGDTGTTGENGTNGKDGADGEDGATFTPSVDANGNLSWTNNKGLTNPPTVNIKGPKGDSGEGGGSSSGSGEGTPVVTNERGYINALEPNVITIIIQLIDGLFIADFVTSSSRHDEYTIIFSTSAQSPTGASISLPDYVLWANGSIPTIEWETVYELSITRDYLMFYTEAVVEETNLYKAVLTPFKAVE